MRGPVVGSMRRKRNAAHRHRPGRRRTHKFENPIPSLKRNRYRKTGEDLTLATRREHPMPDRALKNPHDLRSWLKSIHTSCIERASWQNGLS